ncbi:hypothetical protein [Neptunicella marina]|uniref:Glycine zipper family protein n=1 Tax=Neptunicella marina TaxID=2125989 RepID=A0A8J6M0B5_9ALTE|nr:hypothetical protein [Neptunicella marina]MBC3767105.1 hypothetical protein [Neptunicella marina]
MKKLTTQFGKAEKPVVVGIGVGVAIGVALGVALQNFVLGIGIGIAIGAAMITTQNKQKKNTDPKE